MLWVIFYFRIEVLKVSRCRLTISTLLRWEEVETFRDSMDWTEGILWRDGSETGTLFSTFSLILLFDWDILSWLSSLTNSFLIASYLSFCYLPCFSNNACNNRYSACSSFLFFSSAWNCPICYCSSCILF